MAELRPVPALDPSNWFQSEAAELYNLESCLNMLSGGQTSSILNTVYVFGT